MAIMDSQCKDDNNSVVRSCCIHDEDVNSDDIVASKYAIVYGTPESWLQPKSIMMLKDRSFQNNIVLIVSDEAHCIPKW